MYKEPNYDKVLLLSVGYLIIYLPDCAVACMAPKLLEDLGYGNLGFISMAVDYLFLSFGSLFFAHYFVHRLSPRANMVICCCAMVLWNIAFLFPAYKYKYPETDSWLVSHTFIYTITLLFMAI